MGRRKQPERPAATQVTERDVNDARAILRDCLASLRRQLTVLDARQAELLPGSFDPDVANAIATLNRAATGSVAELRKLETHDRKSVTEMNPDEVSMYLAEYLKELSPDGRSIFRAVLDECDEKDSILGQMG